MIYIQKTLSSITNRKNPREVHIEWEHRWPDKTSRRWQRKGRFLISFRGKEKRNP